MPESNHNPEALIVNLTASLEREMKQEFAEVLTRFDTQAARLETGDLQRRITDMEGRENDAG